MTKEGVEAKYDLRLCIQCGKCTGGCPVSANSPLNVRGLMRKALLGRDMETISQDDQLWCCTTCSQCQIRCPKELKPMELVIGLRESLVEEGRFPKTVQDALEGICVHGNPWGRGRNKRAAWADGLDVKNITGDEQTQVLYFVGCAPSYDDRIQKVAQAVARCLDKLGVDFGILGDRESCCGNEVRRMGENGLFEMLVEDNTALFQGLGVQAIVATSPHCFNAFKNEYPDLAVEAKHYTQIIADLLVTGESPASGQMNKSVVYHDPCFLGKQNGVFDEPRAIIRSIPGVTLMEFDRARERSLCCESGGGRMWFEPGDPQERAAEARVSEAVAMGAEIIATACPFCLLTLEDAVKTTGCEERVRIMDVAELLCEAMWPES